ncbi:helix-turn-helix transcriptional regulator [Paraburkholderia caledonica]|uniref:Excisionase family DNA binding protein n=1 Tax=Paraburkholderia caledonica TaxID=134536 RepID=A0ABU1L283_9BURK|nr:transcriptional regulator [Paraburkholderia caledonica]MDR6377326.1 excisionase family DNA binding protein [Paraburkholderia caledonica]
MTTASSAGVDSTLLHFDLLPDSAFVPVDTLASLLGVSIATVRRRIADGKIPAPKGVLGLQRYQVSTVRELLKTCEGVSA